MLDLIPFHGFDLSNFNSQSGQKSTFRCRMKEGINKSRTSCSRASESQAEPCLGLKSASTRLSKLIFILCGIGSELASRSSPVLSPVLNLMVEMTKSFSSIFEGRELGRRARKYLLHTHHLQKLLQGQGILAASSRWDQQILQLPMDCGERNRGFQKTRPSSFLKPALTSHNVTLYPSKLKVYF
jgi:hypothetical protein